MAQILFQTLRPKGNIGSIDKIGEIEAGNKWSNY